MLGTTGRALVAGGAGTILYGVLFGNLPIVAAGSLPLFLAATGNARAPPRAKRTLGATRIERGGHVDVTLEVDLPRGVGLVEVHQALPEEFRLLSGNNLQVATLGLRPRRLTHTFRVRAPKRGAYELPPVTVRLHHPLGLTDTGPVPQGDAATLEVLPRPLAARMPRDLRARAKSPFPEGDVARMGIPTDDFKEIRQYVPGDPARRINWKASARNLASGDDAAPLVNETEREGKKKVWLLVDGHARLSAGTNVEDAREHAADAALSIAEVFLRRNFAVGVSLARSGDVPPEHASSGEAQIRRIRRALARLQPEDGPTFEEVLARDAALLHRNRPLVVLVTRLAGHDADLEAALQRIGALTRGRGLVPGLVVDVCMPPEPRPDDVAHEAARLVLDRQRRALHNLARGAGLRVVSWHPKEEPLTAVLVRGRIA